MDSVMQLELWRDGPKDDGIEAEPIPSVKAENEKAYKLVEQLRQLASYEIDSDKEERRKRQVDE